MDLSQEPPVMTLSNQLTLVSYNDPQADDEHLSNTAELPSSKRLIG